MFAVLGVFAAAGAESADAQQTPDAAAVAQVYSESSTVITYRAMFDTNTGVLDTQIFPILLTLSDAVTAIMGEGFDNVVNIGFRNQNHRTMIWELISDSGVTTAADGVMNNLPVFGGEGVMAAGDRVRLFDGPDNDSDGEDFDITLRAYDKGGDLFLAAGESPTVKAAAVSGAEFFLTEPGYMSATVLQTGIIGFEPVQCPSGVESLPNMLDCDFPDPVVVEPPVVSMSIGNGGGGEMPGDNTGGGGENGETVVRNNDKRDFPVVGAIVMGLLIFGLSDGGEGDFSYSPSFGYSVNESGYSANVGGRMNFRKDEWRLFYTAGQANANGAFGDFRYSSGGEYKADFWQASFSESVQGKTADYDLSLSADLSGGIWSLSPVYRIHSRLEKGKTATKNTLNLEGVLEYERWTIRQSAGFGWRRMENFGDSAKFRLEAVREF